MVVVTSSTTITNTIAADVYWVFIISRYSSKGFLIIISFFFGQTRARDWTHATAVTWSDAVTNARSLTYWATRELQKIFILNLTKAHKVGIIIIPTW